MLVDVFRAVRADFKLSGCGATVLFGEVHKAVNAEPNRVVFIPRQDGEYVAPVPSISGAYATGIGANPRSLMTRNAGCDVWIWGAAKANDLGVDQLCADYDVLNALINQTALSLYRACGLGRVLTITGGKHDVNALIVNRGLAYTMSIRVAIPIVDIDFPCGAIGPDATTYTIQDEVSANITVNEYTPTGPTGGGNLMSSMTFQVSGE